MKMLSIVIALVSLAGFTQAQTKKFANDAGCMVEAVKRSNGLSLFVTDGHKKTAVVSFLDDLSNGNIAAFCINAHVIKSGNVVTLSCDKQEESGSIVTRGQAKIDFTNGLSSVAVEGQYKKHFVWKTDTDIVCNELHAL